MSYPARQCLAKTIQAMVCELFTNFDQKAGRKSITCGASSEKLPAVPISPLLHESNVSAPSKDSLISVFSAAFPRKVFGNADWGSSRTVKIIQKKPKDFRPLSRSETICSRRVMELIARNRPPYYPNRPKRNPPPISRLTKSLRLFIRRTAQPQNNYEQAKPALS